MRVIALVLDQTGAERPPGRDELQRLAHRYLEHLVRTAYPDQPVQLRIPATEEEKPAAAP